MASLALAEKELEEIERDIHRLQAAGVYAMVYPVEIAEVCSDSRCGRLGHVWGGCYGTRVFARDEVGQLLCRMWSRMGACRLDG
jgi:hypothetical protein